MECINNGKTTTDTQQSNSDRTKENNNNQSEEIDDPILELTTKDANRNLTEKKCGSNLRFGIDFILKDIETADKPLPLTCKKRSTETFESDRNSVDKGPELSDDGSDVNADNASEGNEVISSNSSLNLFGYPQLSVLIRSNNAATQGPELRVFPPSLQIGAVGLQLTSFNDVRKDRFGCKCLCPI